MKSKAAEKALKNLSLSVGEFIRYWGFRRIHGAIWTQLYLSPTGLSGTELAQRLGVSKALVSPALAELEKWKLIREVESGDNKTRLYEAEPDVNAVILHVLKTREKLLLERVAKHHREAQSASASQMVTPARLENLGRMIGSANLMLELILAQEEVLDFPAKLGQ